MKRKKSMKPSAREMRVSVAYARLAAKALRNGDSRGYGRYVELQIRHARRAQRMKELEDGRGTTEAKVVELHPRSCKV